MEINKKMKKIFFFSLLAGTLSSCNFTSSTNEEANKEPSKKILTTSILSDKKDYSCGMTLQEGQIADTTSYNGKVYGFCAEVCKEDFLKDPEAALNKK